MNTDSPSTQKSIDLLARELKLANVNLKALLPRWARARPERDLVLFELLQTLDLSVHEGRIPSYSCLIAPKDAELLGLLAMPKAELPLARKAADGSSALVVLKAENFEGLMLLNPASTPEFELAQLTAKHDAIGLKRDRNGIVRMFTSAGSLRHIGRRWSLMPPVDDAIRATLVEAPMVNPMLLSHLLHFAYYVLSPWQIGATLVWLLDDNDPYSDGIHLSPLKAAIVPHPQGPSLAFAAHLLDQYDGATIISKEGKLKRIGVQLSPSAEAQRLISRKSGTRHTSAKRESFDKANAILVTVSADGPVTIFSDGMSVFEMTWYDASAQARAMVRAVGKHYANSVDVARYSVVCPGCGKTSQIEIFIVYGYKDREEANCPICDKEIASEMCFRIEANLMKTF